MTARALIRFLRPRNRAFALIELMGALAVIGVLTSIAAPQYVESQRKAQDHVATVSIMTATRYAKAIYLDNNQAYPSTDQVVLELPNQDEPIYSFRAQEAGASTSTGPTDLSVNVDDPDTITFCALSKSTRTFCGRFREGHIPLADGTFFAMTAGYGSHGEEDAVTALPGLHQDAPATDNSGPTNTGDTVSNPVDPSTDSTGTTTTTTDPNPTTPSGDPAPATPGSTEQPNPDPVPVSDPSSPAPTSADTGSTTPPASGPLCDGTVDGSSNGSCDSAPSSNCTTHNAHVSSSTAITNANGRASVSFTVDHTGCDVLVSLVSYTAPDPYFDANDANQQKIYDEISFYAPPGSHQMTVSMPNCYFQADFVYGMPIDTLGPAGSNNFYSPQQRLIKSLNGGSVACTSTSSTTSSSPAPPAPSITFTSEPPTSSQQTSDHFEWTNEGGAISTQTCLFDMKQINCPLTTVDLPGVSPGSHTFTVDVSGPGGHDSDTWTWTVEQPPNDRLIVNGTHDYATATNLPEPTGAFEVGAWVNLYTAPNGSHGSTIAAYGCTWSNGANCQGSDAGWSLTVDSSLRAHLTIHTAGNGSKAWADDTNGSGACSLNTSHANRVTTHSWHYVSAAYDPNGRISVYVDGKLQDCSAPLSGKKIVYGANTNTLLLGAQTNPGGNTPSAAELSGSIGEFRMTIGGGAANPTQVGPASSPGVLFDPAENGRPAAVMYHFGDLVDSAHTASDLTLMNGAHLSNHDEY